MNFSYSPSISGHFSSQCYVPFHTNCFIDEGCEAFSIVEDKLFFVREKRFWIGVRLGTEWDRLDWTVTPFGNQDSGVFVFHVNMIKGSWALFIVLEKGELRKFKRPIHQILIPQESRVDSWLRFIIVVRWRGGVLESGAIYRKWNSRRRSRGSGIVLSFGKECLDEFGDQIRSGRMRQFSG
jgi:hypothetical protein